MAEAKAKRDLTSRSAVQGLAKWIGKESGAIVVMVLRAEDHVFWVHPLCSANDGADLVESLLGDMVAETSQERETERQDRELKAARKKGRDGR